MEARKIRVSFEVDLEAGLSLAFCVVGKGGPLDYCPGHHPLVLLPHCP